MSNGPITSFRIGGVLKRGFDVLGRNFFAFGALTALFTLPPLVVGMAAGTGSYYFEYNLDGGDRVGGVTFGVFALILAWLLLYFLVFATLTHGTICDLRGTPTRLGASLSWALGRLFPVVGITIVASVCALFGIFALVVPGLFLITVWWVAVPSTVVERTGVFASLARSYELTRGYRWPVFGVILVIYLGQFVLEKLAQGLLQAAPIFSIFASIVVTILFTAYIAVVTAVCYHDLRVLKEGIGVDEIARVFD